MAPQSPPPISKEGWYSRNVPDRLPIALLPTGIHWSRTHAATDWLSGAESQELPLGVQAQDDWRVI